MPQSYVSFIERALADRQKTNAAYSVRAFAREVKVPHQTLSAVLNGRQNLSTRTARRLTPHLRLTPSEEQHFFALVDAKYQKNPTLRQVAQTQLDKIHLETKIKPLSSEIIRFISDWYHGAILMLLEFENFSPQPAWIATQLSISEKNARDGFDRLHALELIQKKNGRWMATDKILSLRALNTSKCFQSLYSQMMQIAAEKMRSLPAGTRELSATYLAIGTDDYAFVAEEMMNFRKQLMIKIKERRRKPEAVFCLGMQFVPLTAAAALTASPEKK